MNEPAHPSGKQLVAALTGEQIEHLLDVVARTGALEKLDAQFQAADPDLAQTVRALLGSTKPTVAASPEDTVSNQKAIETWDELWGQWDGHVSEVGDEKGDYAIQENDWDPPYFDPTALADDLEKVAQPMLEWLDRIFPLVKEPDLFAQAIEEIDENIGTYPDWMQGGDDFCGLGPLATECVLRWTWSACEGHPTRGQEFLQRIHRLGQESKRVGLNTEACFKFFTALPAEYCREIHACLGAEEYTEVRENTRSVWHRIHHHLEQDIDPTAHLRSCETHLPSNWHYGEALIADALGRKDYAQAEHWVERTFASFLGLTEAGAWRPEDSLLPPAAQFYYGSAASDNTRKLLAQWEEIAVKRKATLRVASCRLQRAVYTAPAYWPEVLRAFEEFQQQGGAGKVGEKLFAEWRDRMASACDYHDGQKPRLVDSWVTWLIEARRAPATRTHQLVEHLDVWFECFAKHASFFGQQWRSLALLTRVLPGASQVKERYPTFYAQVLVPSLGLDPKLEQSLREAFAALAAAVAQLDPMPIWEKHLHALVPSPERTGSNYREQALWMKALGEVNQTAYDKLLTNWQVVYRRRRNLWAEMKALKLPGL
ncbi:MAG: hypothetical protein NT154_37235 [Verrucomicrobia bacterium]|nr:hypothetical protein [Verrucomicrobiota bacterium]